MNNNQEYILSKALKYAEKGKTYGEIRKFVISQNPDKPVVRKIMAEVDKQLFIQAKNNKHNQKNLQNIIFWTMLILTLLSSFMYYLQGKGIIVFLHTGGIIGYFIYNNLQNLKLNKHQSETRRFKSRY